MRCLWVTRQIPIPADSGELIYSKGLIESLARAGADLTVLCRARGGEERSRTATPPGKTRAFGWSGAPRRRRCGGGWAAFSRICRVTLTGWRLPGFAGGCRNSLSGKRNCGPPGRRSRGHVLGAGPLHRLSRAAPGRAAGLCFPQLRGDASKSGRQGLRRGDWS